MLAKSTKGKSSADRTRPTAIKADELSTPSDSDLSGSDNNQHNSESKDGDSEDSDAGREDDDFGAIRMTEGEAWQLFDDEVKSFFFNIILP